MKNPNTRAEKIVDKNGRATTVHKKDDHISSAARKVESRIEGLNKKPSSYNIEEDIIKDILEAVNKSEALEILKQYGEYMRDEGAVEMSHSYEE